MKKLYLITILLASFLFLSPGIFEKKVDFIKARNKNVCKILKDDVLVYVVFVSNKTNRPFLENDILSTMDSINVAVKWLNEQALLNKTSITIRTGFHMDDNYATVRRELPGGSVAESASKPNFNEGIKNINDWADYICKRIGSSIEIEEKPGIPQINNPRDKEGFIAYLRDLYKVESVALLFMVNNYFVDDMSLAINTMSNSEVEFAIISYKYPSVIAHNILHLFGAADLDISYLRTNEKNVEISNKFFPKDIMQKVEKQNIREYNIGEFTAYLIGWKDKLDAKYKPLLEDKRNK
ncbi:MAG: hypothetical protein JXR58_01090 [Bacteroidales bacterium]|nr:hypothetical protein [Bacteroidales bacterium]